MRELFAGTVSESRTVLVAVKALYTMIVAALAVVLAIV
jgi:hypothetical protein